MENRVVVITGAGRGIGSVCALQFAKAGYDVVINYHGSKERAMKVMEECVALGSHAICIKANVANSEEVEAMMKEVMNTYGKIDVLINNSGITKDNVLIRMSEQEFDDVIDVNLKGSFLCIKHITRIMMKQRQGVILNMTSVIGQVGNIAQANYAASKAGILGLTKSVAKELASRNIRVNAVAPGFIQSEMTDVLSEQIKEGILSNIPLKTLGTCEDVANTLLFLASDQARYITGQVINVDGGMVM